MWRLPSTHTAEVTTSYSSFSRPFHTRAAWLLIGSDIELTLYSVNLFVRLMVEHKADSGSVPHSLEHSVLQAPLVGAVVPLGEVVAAVAVLGGRVGLSAQDAAPAVEPGREGSGSQIPVPGPGLIPRPLLRV